MTKKVKSKHMSKAYFFLVSTFLVGLICLFCACNQKHEYSAVGNWISVSYTSDKGENSTGVDKMLLEINADGSCYLMDSGEVCLGSWQTISDNEIYVMFDFDSDKRKIIIDDKSLHLITDDVTINFERTDMQIPHV